MEQKLLDSMIFYVNPAAGNGKAARVWSALLASEPALARAKVISTHIHEAKSSLAEQLRDGSIERVIAVGGDGTVHTVINSLLALDVSPEVGVSPKVGVISSGTGSDFARCLGLPRNPLETLRFILAQPSKPLDVLRLVTDSGSRRHIINIASAGVSGEVAVAVNALPRKGAWSYIVATLKALRRYRPAFCRVMVDGESFFAGSFFVLAVANGQFFGKGMKVAPEARPDDGLADVVLVPEVPLWQLPLRLPQFISGQHLKLSFVRHVKARTVRVEPSEGFPPFELDGESWSAEAMELSLLPGALQFYF